MNKTRQEYIAEQYKEFEVEGIKSDDYMDFNLDNEYYNLLAEHMKQGGTITQEIFNSLTQGQQYHFTKHYNYRNDKIINSDYEKEIIKAKEQAEKDFNKFLAQKEQKQKEQEIKDQKIKQNTINELTQEIKQLQNSLINYNRLSPIGQRNISKYDHERRQIRIKEKIADIEQKIKEVTV